jgi:hypothetical protein
MTKSSQPASTYSARRSATHSGGHAFSRLGLQIDADAQDHAGGG